MGKLEDLAAAAAEALASSDDRPEPLMGPGNEWRVQVAKGCWYLGAARRLDGERPKAGDATAVVELSLCAVERTLQGMLMRQYDFGAEDFQRHRYAIEEAGRRGIITPALAAHLSEMWAGFRNENYYQSSVPDGMAARKTQVFARELHVQLMRRRAEYRAACRCAR